MNRSVEYQDLLRKLSTSGAHFLVIGSMGLYLHRPLELREYFIPDCDLLTRPDRENISVLISELEKEGFDIRLWDMPWRKVPKNEWEGKWYLRARKGELQIDLTFECPWLDFDSAMSGALRIDGFLVAAERDIWHLKKVKSVDQAKEFADHFGLTML